jgi:hypothetical protein
LPSHGLDGLRQALVSGGLSVSPVRHALTRHAIAGVTMPSYRAYHRQQGRAAPERG